MRRSQELQIAFWMLSIGPYANKLTKMIAIAFGWNMHHPWPSFEQAGKLRADAIAIFAMWNKPPAHPFTY